MKLKVALVAVPLMALAFVASAVAKTGGGTAETSPTAGTSACGKTRAIGVAAPLTGPAAAIGQQQLHWAQYYVKLWNALKVNRKRQIKIVQGDTQLAVDTTFAIRVAQSFAANSKILAVVGPAGSEEVVASTPAYERGGLAWISGSATRDSLTDGHTDGNRRGYFFRVVPGDAAQAPSVANYITRKLKATRVFVVDDQESYSQGLADSVQALLRTRKVTVTRDSVSQQTSDFTPLIAKIPANTQVVYIPWQLAPRAQALGQQMQAKGKGKISLFGSDTLFDPANFRIAGAYDSFFPVDTSSPIVKTYARAHSGDGEYFGAPSFVATQVAVGAVTKACADGKATRAEVRRLVARTNLKTSLLGLPVSFTTGGNLRRGGFGIYQVQGNGSYKRVG